MMKKIRMILLIALALAAAVVWCRALTMGSSDDTENKYGSVTVVETADRTTSEVPEAFIKEEYIPVIPDGTNIADLSRFDANGYNDVYLPGKAKDGDTKGASYWEGAADSYPNILTAVYNENVNVHAIRLLLCPLSIWGTRIQAFSVEISADGENFTELIPMTDYTFDPNKGNEVVIEFDEVNIAAIRLNFTKNTGAVGAQVAEFEIYSNDEFDLE